MVSYSISDLSSLTGVKTHTLRIWEKRYGFLKPQRTGTNIRYYDDNDLRILKLAQKLNQQGVRISRIAEMSLPEMEEECRLISPKHIDYEGGLQKGLINMDVTSIDSVLESSIRHQGFETTLRCLIIPFLEKMEVMWLSCQIGEAEEVCFREIVRRKTTREIDTLPHNCDGPRIIMFLPTGNHHEMNHLFMHYYLRRQGFCVTDLGCDVNLDCATAALKKCNSECVIVVNSDPVHWQFSSFVRELAKQTNLPIIVAGKAADKDWINENEQVIVLNDMEETILFVSKLEENIKNYMS